jgi:hypothetical protein
MIFTTESFILKVIRLSYPFNGSAHCTRFAKQTTFNITILKITILLY